jgi:hypothetical protein
MVGDRPVTETRPLGPLIHSFFLDLLVTVKGLRPASVRSYRDTIRLRAPAKSRSWACRGVTRR